MRLLDKLRTWAGAQQARRRVGGNQVLPPRHPNRPKGVEAYNNLAVAYYNWGSYAEAVKACNRELALDENYAAARYTLGLIYVDLGSKEQALDQHALLKELDPDWRNTCSRRFRADRRRR